MTEAKKRLDALHEMDSTSALKLLVSEPWGKHKFIGKYKGVEFEFYSENKEPGMKEILDNCRNKTGFTGINWRKVWVEWVPY